MQDTLGEQLRAALNQWEREEKQEAAPVPVSYQKTSPFAITNNLNRKTFSCIQNSPGTRKEITEHLVKQGFKLGSVSAVIGHMLRQGVAVIGSDGVLRVTTPEYVPLKSYKTIQNMKKKTQERKKVVVVSKKTGLPVGGEKRPVSSSVGGIAALSPAPTPVPAPVSPEQFVFKLLESLSVLQARAVYDELKKIFGDR